MTLHCLLTVLSARNSFAYQLDVQNTFVHGALHEEVYMESPPGLQRQHENTVCRLNKSFMALSKRREIGFSHFQKLSIKLVFNNQRLITPISPR